MAIVRALCQVILQGHEPWANVERVIAYRFTFLWMVWKLSVFNAVVQSSEVTNEPEADSACGP